MKLADAVPLFKVELSVDPKLIVGMFVVACEGGSNYWCQKLTPKGKEGDAYEQMLDGFTLVDGEAGGKKHVVTTVDIHQAVKLMAEKYPRHFADMISEQDDGFTGDVFLQLCVFKDVIYG